MKPKILLFDEETAPSLGHYFDLWKEGNIVDTVKDCYMLCFAYKWLGDKKVSSYALPDFKGYKPGSEDDKELIKKLWELFNEADVLVAHNGDKFDIRKANARFAYYNLPPPSPYKTIDTLKVAKRYFNFTSNKLDSLGKHLGYGSKLVHTGFNLWRGCMSGDPNAWKHMIEYNKRDVVLLEKIYLHFRPWIQNHPNISILMNMPNGCPGCGSKNLTKMGTDLTQSGRVQQYQCKACKKWSRGKHEKVTNIK
ncbi:MAG: ribonuclease H-like domain-containing protein [Blastocatellia bacterium]